jgi:fused signal recognition particle receptor
VNPFARIGAGFKKLASGLAKTRQVFQRLLVAANTEELEEALLAADVGVKATEVLVDKVKRAAGDRRLVLETEIARLLNPKLQTLNPKPQPPLVVMIVGVNGSGKTTTVG